MADIPGGRKQKIKNAEFSNIKPLVSHRQIYLTSRLIHFVKTNLANSRKTIQLVLKPHFFNKLETKPFMFFCLIENHRGPLLKKHTLLL